MRKIHGIIILSLLLLCSHNAFAVGAPDYLPDGAHPRMLTTERLNRLKDINIANTDQQWIEMIAKFSSAKNGESDWDTSNKHPEVMALLFLVTGDDGYKVAAINNLVAGVDKFNVAWRATDESDMWRYVSDRLFYSYDLMYQYLTPTQRKTFANDFAAWATAFKTEGYKIDDSSNNYFGAHFRASALVPIVAWGEVIDDVDAAQLSTIMSWVKPGGQLYNTLSTQWEVGGKYEGGILTEGPEYTPQTARYIFSTFDYLRIATGLNLYTTQPFSTWISNHIKYLFYDMIPGGYSYPRNDWLNGHGILDPTSVTPANIRCVLILAENTTGIIHEELIYYIDKFTPTQSNWWLPDDQGFTFFATNRGGAKTDYRTQLPTKWFNGNNIGIVYGRSGWGDMDTLWSFQAGWTGSDHMHAGTGHFIIRRNGEWIINHPTSWAADYDEPERHNIIGIQTTHPYNRWTKDEYNPDKWSPVGMFGSPSTKDGPDMRDLPDIEYTEGAWFEVSVADMTNHYWGKEFQYHVPQPLENVIRNFVHIGDGLFLIDDKFKINHCLDYAEWNADPSQSKDCDSRFILHLLHTDQGIISGNVINKNTALNSTTITAVFNDTSTWNVIQTPTLNITGGGTSTSLYDRFEIHGDSTIKQQHSLVVVDTRDVGVQAKSITKITGDTVSGAMIDDKVVLFADNYANIDVSNAVYTITTNVSTRHLISGVRHSFVYNIVINGGISNQVTSSAGGVLSFDVVNTGTVNVIISENGSACDTAQLDLCLSQETCEVAMGYWCDNVCQSEVCFTEIRADVDQNGTVNSTDAMLTLRNSLGLDMSGTNWQASATTGDVNCDDVTNSTDAMLILRYSLGLDMSGTGWCE